MGLRPLKFQGRQFDNRKIDWVLKKKITQPCFHNGSYPSTSNSREREATWAIGSPITEPIRNLK